MTGKVITFVAVLILAFVVYKGVWGVVSVILDKLDRIEDMLFKVIERQEVLDRRYMIKKVNKRPTQGKRSNMPHNKKDWRVRN